MWCQWNSAGGRILWSIDLAGTRTGSRKKFMTHVIGGLGRNLVTGMWLCRWPLALLVAAGSTPPVHAQSAVTWQGDNAGHPSDWSKAPNWTPGGRPTATEIAQFINVAANTNPNLNTTGLVVGEV